MGSGGDEIRQKHNVTDEQMDRFIEDADQAVSELARKLEKGKLFWYRVINSWSKFL